MIQQTNLYRPYLIGLICCLIYFTPQNIYAQNIISVNNLTGTANATIPIYNVTVGDLQAPVALTYNATGLKVENYDNSFGQGWNLIAPASITREVRGFPDDVEYQSHSSYSIIKGWIRPGNTAPQTIQNLTLYNSTPAMNCAGEITDANTIANNFAYTYDTEPDYFNISAPGLNGSFVFDAATNHLIKTIPYRDYKITYTVDGNGKINSFTVINENGIKYFFDNANLLEHYIESYNQGTTVEINPGNLEAFKRDFMMYRNKVYLPGYPLGAALTYYDNWTLSKMEDTKGNRIIYTYQLYTIQNPEIYKRTSEDVIEILKPDGNGVITKKKLYTITKKRISLRLLSISTVSTGGDFGSIPAVQFTWSSPSGSPANEDTKLTTINLPLEKKQYELLYTYKFRGSSSVWYAYGRYFLKGLKATTANELCNNVYTKFDFAYYDVDEAANTCYCTPVNPNNPSQTIDTIINAQDYWGYYNGNFLNPNLNPAIYVYPDNAAVELFKVYPNPNYTAVILTETANRAVNPHAKDGSLKKITYPAGGFTELEYENNEFFDNDVNGNVLGGGIRIKKITNNDGLIPAAVDVTEYSYNDPVNTSLTTGRAISVPKFTLAFQNSNNYGGNITNKVKNSTYRTTYDLNNEPKDILYGTVTVKKTGIGKSVYEYNTSGTFGSAALTDWDHTKNFVARTNLSPSTPCTAIAPSFLYVNNAKLQYPFASNANYDFEQGLLTKLTHKNEAGQTVATEEYTYTRSHTNPTKIYALKLDDIGNTMAAYGKYWVNTVVDNFLTTKTSKLYNTNAVTPITDVENYNYTPQASTLPYRLLKDVQKQNSDGTTLISTFKYAKEYDTLATGDEMNAAIKEFNATNNNVLIESSQNRTDLSGTKTIGASVHYFKQYGIGLDNSIIKSLPLATHQFVSQTGVTNFVFSYINGSGNFTKSINYIHAPATIEKYGTNGLPELITDNTRIAKTILTDLQYNNIIAEFVNAKPQNIGFANFDAAHANGFNIGSGNTIEPGGRYSTNCLNFQPNTVIYRSLERQVSAKNLIVSFWLKDAESSGNIYICVQKFGSCGTFSCSGASGVIPFAVGSQWKYYQFIIPWTSTLTTFCYGLSTSVAVKIDDILIYPDNANVSSLSYTTNTMGTNRLTAKTGINGLGNSYEYDKAGRLWLVRDQFDNIIEMKKYKLTNRHPQQIPSISISYPYQTVLGSVSTFTAEPPYTYETGDCDAPPIKYMWNFGDGFMATVSYGSGSRGGTTITHTFAAIGTYQVSVTASSPGMTSILPAQTPPVNSTNPPPVTVVNAPPPCYSGTPVICASGIIQWTATNQCVQTSCTTTPALPNTCYDTYFKLIDITGGSLTAVYSVEWETAFVGIPGWTTHQLEIVGTGGFITFHHFSKIHTPTYQMRAKIKFNNCTDIFYSNIITVVNDF